MLIQPQCKSTFCKITLNVHVQGLLHCVCVCVWGGGGGGGNCTLDYMLFLESETILAQPVVEALLELVQAMDSEMEAEEVCRCGRPRIAIGEEQLRFFGENGFRRQASFSAVSAQLNVDWPRCHEHHLISVSFQTLT